MPTQKLTQKIVNSLPQSEKLILYFDEAIKGFGVYTTKNAKTFFIQARVNGKEKKRSIGKASLMSLDEARTEAKGILALMAKGVDPVEEERKQSTLTLTLEKAFEKYQESRQLKPRTIKCYRDLLNSYVKEWLEQPIASITKEMIASKHTYVGDNHGKNAANNLMRTLSSLYNFAYALSDQNIDPNPVYRMRQTRKMYKVAKRETFIHPRDLHYWYAATMKIENHVIRDYLLLLIFTGLRKQEGLQLKWDEVDMRNRIFTIPPERSKNGKSHTLPMSTYIYNLFKQRRLERENGYVFPGPGKAGHLVEPDKQILFIERESKLAMNNVANQAELDEKIANDPEYLVEDGIKFCLHDLRRTFITVAESIDISYASLQKLLNHSDGNSVTSGYIQITTERLREPMERISSKLMELMGIPAALPENSNEAEPNGHSVTEESN